MLSSSCQKVDIKFSFPFIISIAGLTPTNFSQMAVTSDEDTAKGQDTNIVSYWLRCLICNVAKR